MTEQGNDNIFFLGEIVIKFFKYKYYFCFFLFLFMSIPLIANHFTQTSYKGTVVIEENLTIDSMDLEIAFRSLMSSFDQNDNSEFQAEAYQFTSAFNLNNILYLDMLKILTNDKILHDTYKEVFKDKSTDYSEVSENFLVYFDSRTYAGKNNLIVVEFINPNKEFVTFFLQTLITNAHSKLINKLKKEIASINQFKKNIFLIDPFNNKYIVNDDLFKSILGNDNLTLVQYQLDNIKIEENEFKLIPYMVLFFLLSFVIFYSLLLIVLSIKKSF